MWNMIEESPAFRRSLRFGGLLAMAVALAACAGEAQDDGSAAAAAVNEGQDDPLVKYEINKAMGDGDSFEVPLDPKRKLQQITMIYDGNYSIPALDANGQPKKSDEGKTYYKDGMYAHGFVVSANGSKEEVSVPKFVDSNETDNWHDLKPLSGQKLRVEFGYGAEYKNDPAVVAAHTKVQMTRVIIQYQDPEGLTSEIFDYDLGDEQKSKAEISSGGAFSIDFDGKKEVYRVDVRWGDAKPRNAQGEYVPGRASGYLTVDGFRSDTRNVAMIETQAFSVKNATAQAGSHKIAVHMTNDSGRVHWIKVFYR